MLEVYLDDSGTHVNSRVAVWGGIVGFKEFIDQFKIDWTAQLCRPCEGRPPIKKFHSAELASGQGEFKTYGDAEKNLTRRNFRQQILDSQLTVVSVGISTFDWEDLVTEDARPHLGSAERSVFGQVIKICGEAAKIENLPISFIFDQGRESDALQSIIKPALDYAEIDENFVQYEFRSVAEDIGLQAADLVAHETYQFFNDYIDDTDAVPGPHLKRLFEGSHDAQAAWVGRRQIQEMMSKLDQEFDFSQSHYRK